MQLMHFYVFRVLVCQVEPHFTSLHLNYLPSSSPFLLHLKVTEMGFTVGKWLGFLVVVVTVVNGDPLVPALLIFGDSVVDTGNNNNLYTAVKANFPPYGRDFVNHTPTGRFCNGKLATDFTGMLIGEGYSLL